MSKINIIRDAFESLADFLEGNDVTCVFFNNLFEIMTTLPIENTPQVVGNIPVHEIVDKIRKVRCCGTTDFNQVAVALEKINEFSSEKREVSFICSDGYHTNFSNDTNTLRQNLEGYFDYALGLGNSDTEFDKELLMRISKQFVFGRHGSAFKKILAQVEEISTINEESACFYIPPGNEIIVFNSPVVDNVNFVEPTQCNFDIHYNYDVGLKQSIIQLGNYTQYTSHAPKHYIFVIDISASMDEHLLSGDQVLTLPTSHSPIKRLENTEMWTRISCQLDKHRTLMIGGQVNGTIYINIGENFAKLVPNNINYKINSWDKVYEYFNSLENANVFEDKHFQSRSIHDDYSAFKKDDMSEQAKSILQSHFEMQMSQITNGDKRTFSNIEKNKNHKPRSIEFEVQEVDSLEPETCLICCVNKRNIVFNCFHVAVCSACTSTMLSTLEIKCPVCRKRVSWMKTCRYINMKCLTLGCNNKISTYHNPCGHIYYCNTCSEVLQQSSCLCNNEIESTFQIVFP